MPRIFPKSLKQGSQISKRVSKANFFITLIGYISKSSENLILDSLQMSAGRANSGFCTYFNIYCYML